MNIVVKYAKRGKDDHERIRRVVFSGLRPNDWMVFIHMAQDNKVEGERVIAIIEGGYH